MKIARNPRCKRHLVRFRCYIGGSVSLDRDRHGGRFAWVTVRQWDGPMASALLTRSMARRLAAALDVFAADGDPLSPAARPARIQEQCSA